MTDENDVRLRSFRSISSQRRTSFTNFLWNALTVGFSCRHQKQHILYSADMNIGLITFKETTVV